MGQGPGVRDRFANIASIQTTQSAANALTFSALNTNMGFLGRRDQALAMAIDQLEYHIEAAGHNLMVGTLDFIRMGLTVSDQVTNLEDVTDRRILDVFQISQVFVTAVGALRIVIPTIHQFFPPLITAERTLFLGVNSLGFPSALTVRLRILFRVETLTGAELVELAEVFRLTS